MWGANYWAANYWDLVTPAYWPSGATPASEFPRRVILEAVLTTMAQDDARVASSIAEMVRVTTAVESVSVMTGEVTMTARVDSRTIEN
jgi:hypothetical protein